MLEEVLQSKRHFHQSPFVRLDPLLPQRWRRRAPQQPGRGGAEGEGLKGVLFEGKGRSQSPVHRLSGVGGGAMGLPAGTESVVMSSLARSHVSLSLTHTRGLTSASAPQRQKIIPVGLRPQGSPMSLSALSQGSSHNLQTVKGQTPARSRTSGTWLRPQQPPPSPGPPGTTHTPTDSK